MILLGKNFNLCAGMLIDEHSLELNSSSLAGVIDEILRDH
jgi:hypothetical protein